MSIDNEVPSHGQRFLHAFVNFEVNFALIVGCPHFLRTQIYHNQTARKTAQKKLKKKMVKKMHQQPQKKTFFLWLLVQLFFSALLLCLSFSPGSFHQRAVFFEPFAFQNCVPLQKYPVVYTVRLAHFDTNYPIGSLRSGFFIHFRSGYIFYPLFAPDISFSCSCGIVIRFTAAQRM